MILTLSPAQIAHIDDLLHVIDAKLEPWGWHWQTIAYLLHDREKLAEWIMNDLVKHQAFCAAYGSLPCNCGLDALRAELAP